MEWTYHYNERSELPAMINFYPYKLSFWAWLRLLFTGRRVYLAVQLDPLGNPQAVNILPRKPKGAQPLTPEAQQAQAQQFEAARQQLLKEQEAASAQASAQGGTGRYAGRKGRKGRK
jgi:hypothetical protein